MDAMKVCARARCCARRPRVRPRPPAGAPATAPFTRAAAVKVKAHNPALVIPVIFSAGGALRACDNDLLPEPEDRNGRHWMRVELHDTDEVRVRDLRPALVSAVGVGLYLALCAL